MKTYTEVIEYEARLCYMLYRSGSMGYRPTNINIISFIYDSQSVEIDIEKAFDTLVEYQKGLNLKG